VELCIAQVVTELFEVWALQVLMLDQDLRSVTGWKLMGNMVCQELLSSIIFCLFYWIGDFSRTLWICVPQGTNLDQVICSAKMFLSKQLFGHWQDINVTLFPCLFFLTSIWSIGNVGPYAYVISSTKSKASIYALLWLIFLKFSKFYVGQNKVLKLWCLVGEPLMYFGLSTKVIAMWLL
jgi:hypothetical protein